MRIIVFEEKHCTRYFSAKTDEDRNKACQKIVLERIDRGYYLGKDLEEAKWIEENKDSEEALKRAWDLVNKCNYGEYESYEIEYLEDV